MRTALERVLGGPVHLLVIPGGRRLTAPAPPPRDPVWPRLLATMRGADAWGSTDTTGTPEIWVTMAEESE